MSNQRDPNKVEVRLWVTKENKTKLRELASLQGYKHLSDYIADRTLGTSKPMDEWVDPINVASPEPCTNKELVTLVLIGLFVLEIIAAVKIILH